MAQIFTGAKARVEINGTAIGFVGGLNVNQENTLTDVDVIGLLEVGDLAETAHKINFSINYFKALAVAPEDLGVPAAGAQQIQTAALLGIDTGATEIASMRNQAFFNVVVFDDQGNEIYKMENCKFEGGSGQVDARGVWNGTWNFRAKTGFGL